MTAEKPQETGSPAPTGAVPSGGGRPDAAPGLTYPGAPETVIKRWMVRRSPVQYGNGDALPPLDTDLAPLATDLIPHDEPDPTRRLSPYRRKLWQLRLELAGQPELALLNAILIVNLRRKSFPDHAPALFLRVWKEHGETLMRQLPGRWLISSIITFGDVGETEAQRRIGLALNVLFSTMKLYEAERTFSGFPAHAVFRRRRMCSRTLPLGMSGFGFHRGGLDFNLLGPIWQEAMAEPVAGPLACHLLERLNADPGNIFRRIRQMSVVRKVKLDDRPKPGAAPDPGAPDPGTS